MPRRDVIVVGASAGGVEALTSVVRGLPPDLPAAVLVVLHVPAGASGALPAILKRAGSLPADRAVDGEDLRPGRIYVAPADHHLMVVPDRVVLSRGARENGHRPAIDLLFRSAAHAFGPRVVGVILSGALDDGTAGLAAIVAHGGAAIVQDPHDALHSSVPLSAIEQVRVDHVAAAAQIGALLALLTREEAITGGGATTAVESTTVADPPELPQLSPPRAGEDPSPVPAGLTCPDCQGSLSSQAADRGHVLTADRYDAAAQDGQQAVSVIREALRVAQAEAAEQGEAVP